MTTVASPVSVREQALGIIAEHVRHPAELSDGLEEIGGAVLISLLVDLEEHFDIGLDVDELLPNGTVGVLVGLVEIRAKAQASGTRIYHWDDERARRALPLCRPPRRAAEVLPFEIVEALQRPGLPHGSCGACRRDATLNAWGVCLVCFCEGKAAPPPPPPPPRVEIAVPSDEAWERALKVYAAERTRRFALLVLALVTTLAGVSSGIAWAALAGWL